jgi:hypothetical protein
VEIEFVVGAGDVEFLNEIDVIRGIAEGFAAFRAERTFAGSEIGQSGGDVVAEPGVVEAGLLEDVTEEDVEVELGSDIDGGLETDDGLEELGMMEQGVERLRIRGELQEAFGSLRVPVGEGLGDELEVP